MIKREELKQAIKIALPIIKEDKDMTEYGTEHIRISVPTKIHMPCFEVDEIFENGGFSLMLHKDDFNVEGTVTSKYADELLQAAVFVGVGEESSVGSKHTVKEEDLVNHPSHYLWLKELCGIEPIDICRHLDFNIGNSIKYLLRKDKRDFEKTKTEKRIEDLRKAIFYILDEIELLNKKL